ncbi:glutamate-5-semialdehyde dehydrogenase [Treponema primitia]|uniref:glutamate-5-semialdehyde dehydrogenase n=1 Tax=Treponema primitia TaxID=88058 RepID=UPI0003176601|nr:glutamate-5-semialdehyde dehydrogenase [Treponema primitia]
MSALENLFESLKKAQAELALQNRGQKDAALKAVMDAIEKGRVDILKANAADVEKARAGGMKEALVDRLLLNDKRINDIIEGIDTVVRQEDPIGKVQTGWVLPNGLQVERTTVPLGVAAIIYESRPNVTADAFSLAYKAGCGILLRGSSAALESNRALVKAIKEGLSTGGGISDALALAESGSRDEVGEILSARGKIDVVLPRGGKDLIRRVVENAKIPVIETGEGNCHIYVDSSADIINAVDIIENAKLQKPGACNAVETVLVHRDIAAVLLPLLAKRLAGKAELRCDNAAKTAIGVLPQSLLLKDAVEEDWETEFLDYILAIKTVDTLEEAVTHINRYGTKHSEAILTNDHRAAEEFERRVDAACVYTNASTRFTDGGQFGFGAELGISTQKFHARGPMGLEALTTIKYRIHGTGQIRP